MRAVSRSQSCVRVFVWACGCVSPTLSCAACPTLLLASRFSHLCAGFVANRRFCEPAQAGAKGVVGLVACVCVCGGYHVQRVGLHGVTCHRVGVCITIVLATGIHPCGLNEKHDMHAITCESALWLWRVCVLWRHLGMFASIEECEAVCVSPPPVTPPPSPPLPPLPPGAWARALAVLVLL